MATKKMDVPDIGNLLGKITEKRESGELPKTEIQRVQPVKNVETENSKAGKKEELAVVPQKPENRPPVGRPSTKVEGVEYVKISPRIPKLLKKAAEFALIEERFRDKHGRPVTTTDEIVTLALERLLEEGRR